MLCVFPNVSEAQIKSALTTQQFSLGHFDVVWQAHNQKLLIKHQSSERIIFESPEDQPLLSVSKGSLKIHENRASFRLDYQRRALCSQQSIDKIESSEHELIIQGALLGHQDCSGAYFLRIYTDTDDLETLKLEIKSLNQDVSQINLHLQSSQSPIYGGGVQPGLINLQGQKIPLLVQEGGVGRGSWPISPLLAVLSPGSEGSNVSSYFPLPVFWQQIEDGLFRAIRLDNDEIGSLDFSQSSQSIVSLFSRSMQLSLQTADTPLKLDTVFQGQTPLPDWVHQGVIVGMQGGTEKVKKVWQELKRRGTPVSAFWLQDWVGRRQTAIGSQLWWNWELDQEHYPDWDALRQELSDDGVRVLGYLNPFLVDVSMRPHQRNLYREAAQKGFLVKDASGAIYPIQNTDFAAGMLDLSRLEARQWFQKVIQEELIEKAGFSGWMADYAEALPFDAALFEGQAFEAHNQYPALWSHLQLDAVQTEACQECFFFARSGYLNSLQKTPLYWLGDQMTDWSSEDGLKSALKAQISGALSGVALTHSDTGGYTSLAQLGIHRSRELLYRWLELNAFTAILRTHEGNQPEANLQFYSDSETYAFFDAMAKVYAALYTYRSKLFKEAEQSGWPILRPLILHYPSDAQVIALHDQFLLGQDFLIAPVLDAGKVDRKIYLPAGIWVHLWSGDIYDFRTQGQFLKIAAPLGHPPVFYLQDSSFGAKLRRDLIQAKIILP